MNFNPSYSFALPEHLIAQQPASPRDAARLLVVDRQSGELKDDHFYNLQKYLPANTSLVLNQTKVDHCRLIFGNIEIFLLKTHDSHRATAMVRPGRKFKLGQEVDLTPKLKAKVLSIDDNGHRLLEFNQNLDSPEILANQHVPLPPYVAQNDKLADEYQTVYANQPGSKAAPTAGLHFTDRLLDQISQQHQLIKLELKVGLGTFSPLNENNFTDKKLHSEDFLVDSKAVASIKSAASLSAVGTTSLRTLESLPVDLELKDYSGSTDIFILPGYKFKRTNHLITNFHLPSTSLLLLVEAFMGDRGLLEASYQHAIKNNYRFYSFGDAMLIL